MASKWQPQLRTSSGVAAAISVMKNIKKSINVNEDIMYDVELFKKNEKTNEAAVERNTEICIDRYIEGNKLKDFKELKSLLTGDFISKPTRDTGYASQGLCHAGSNLLITSYKSGEPSKLDVTNPDGQAKTLKLDVPKGAHVGGVAYHESSGNAYIPANESKLYVYSSKDIANANDGSTLKHCAEIDLRKLKDRPDTISFVNIHENSLYVGAFHLASEGYHSKPEIVKYQLNDDGTVNTKVAPKVYNIPDKVQGFDIVEKNGTEYFIFSTSYGRSNDSKLLICTPDKDGNMQTLKTIKVPCMAEEVSVNQDGKLGIVFESDSTKFDGKTFLNINDADMEIGNVLYIDIDKVINDIDKSISKDVSKMDLSMYNKISNDDIDFEIL